MKTFFCITLFITGLILPFSGYSQEPTNTENIISVKTTLVNIPLIISDKTGRRIADIKKEDVSVYNGKERAEIAFFADTDEPVNYAIVIDRSGSSETVRLRIDKAASQFVDSFSEADQGMVVTFDDKVKVVQRLTANKKNIKSAASAGGIDPLSGATLMNESILTVLEEYFKHVKGRKVIIVLTDAGEINKKSNESLLQELKRSDVLIYPVIYQTLSIHRLVSLSGDTKGGEEVRKMKSISINDLIKYPPFDYLDKLAKVSGGRLLFPDESSFKAAFTNIADELRKQYVVGFYVDADSDADTRNISIKVNRPDAVVRTKSSIRIAPTQ